MERSSRRPILWRVYSRLPEREKQKARATLDRAFRRGLARMDRDIASGTRMETAMRAMLDGMDRFRHRTAKTLDRYRQASANQITDEVVEHLVERHRKEPHPMLVWPDHYLHDWDPPTREAGAAAH